MLSLSVLSYCAILHPVKVKAFASDLPYEGSDFENAYNYAITLNDQNVILYYGKTQVSGNSSVIGYIVCVFDNDVYFKRSNNYLYGYTTESGNTRIRPINIRNYHSNGYSTPNPSSTSLLFESASEGGNIYYNGQVYKSENASTGNLNLIKEIFQPEPTPYPSPSPSPLPSENPLPSVTPIPVITPTPFPEEHGHEIEHQYLYLTDFNLIRANRFFLAYGFQDNRIDLWTNDYVETTEGYLNGTFDIIGYSDGRETGHFSYSEWSRIQDEYGADYVLTLNTTGYSVYDQHFPLACRVTAVTGEAEPDEWTCKTNWDLDGLDSDLYTLVVTPKAPTGQGHDDEIFEHNGLLYMEQIKSGSEIENGAGNGQIIGELHEVTSSDGTSSQTFIWKTSSIIDVTKRTRIYANVLYAPENLTCLNGFNDFELGNEGFQYYSKTFSYQSDNPPVIVSIVYDGVYNASVFSDGVLSYVPYKVINGEKIYQGEIYKDARISGGGVCQIAYFSGFENGDIVGTDIYIDSGFGSIQPIYVGYYRQVPDEVYAIMHGVTQGQAQTDAIIQNAQQIAQDMTSVNNQTIENGVIADTIQFADALEEKGYTYGFQQVAGLKNSLMAVEPQSRISLPAIFDTSKYWVLDLAVVEQNLPQLWTFGRGLIHIWLALNLISQGSALFSYIADDDEGEEMD